MRTLHIGFDHDLYAAIPLLDQDALELEKAKLIYECGNEPGDHDYHINPEHPSFSDLEKFCLALHAARQEDIVDLTK